MSCWSPCSADSISTFPNKLRTPSRCSRCSIACPWLFGRGLSPMVGWLGYHYFMSHSEWSISAQHQNFFIQAALCLISWSTCAGHHGPHNQQSLGILKLGSSSMDVSDLSTQPRPNDPNFSKRLDSPLQKQGVPEFQTPIPSIFPFSMKVFKYTPQLGFNLIPNLQGKLSLPLVAHLVDRRLIFQSSIKTSQENAFLPFPNQNKFSA